MKTPETSLSPFEILKNLIERTQRTWSRLTSSKPGDVNADREIAREITIMENLMAKLNYSNLRKLRKDKTIDEKSYAHLIELEKIGSEIMRAEKEAIHQDHALYKLAKKFVNEVKGSEKKAKREGIRKIKEVKKEQQKVDQKKQQASELVGRKL